MEVMRFLRGTVDGGRSVWRRRSWVWGRGWGWEGTLIGEKAGVARIELGWTRMLVIWRGGVEASVL